MTKKWILGLAFAGLVAAGPALAQKKSLVIGMGSADAGKLDPHLASTTPDKGLLNYVFNGLVRIKPGEASPNFIEPDLAESWTQNANGSEWIFKIRAGVQCHHGFGPFTAEDAAYSLKRAATKATSSYSGDFSAVDKIDVVDPSTLKITLKTPVAGFLGYVANINGGNMVCRKAAEEAGDNFGKRPIGTGPFMFAEYQPQQFVKLVANKQYFRGAPQLDDITFRYIPADSSRDLAFQSGELDMIYGKQDQTWVDRTAKLPGVKVKAMEPGELSALYLNVTAKPLDDIRVRQAIAHAIDRKAIVQFKGEGSSREAVSVVPSGYLGTDQKSALYAYDIAKARQLLTQAGYPNGVTVKTIHTTLTGMQTLIEAVQAQLKKAGITLDIELVEHATFHANIRKDLSPIVHYQAARFPVADVYLTQFYDSNSIVGKPTAVTNFTHCDVADADIRGARTETDAARQLALWKAAQEKLVKNVCGIPIYEQLQLWAWKDTLDLGYELNGSLNLSPPITEKTRFTK
ncbi:ABC transporter substrate-binding protein [Candidatus Raskinella chloraquaticus]|uniref:Polyamine ABC transporter substrate-binding protein n=1 Tax=Candidatus Raskinella chloraquaticus TaxID=1951219 RepID=A0A1W9HQ42_9HYPH|nr:MAG: polyamine ABC transporter substrate-binding protein [Proteobacteria bacterium SG_bin8]